MKIVEHFKIDGLEIDEHCITQQAHNGPNCDTSIRATNAISYELQKP